MSGQHFAIEVEQALLGAMMMHAGAIERIESDLQPAHFCELQQSLQRLEVTARVSTSLLANNYTD